jgi:putative lipoic acid-binding regulatory protein
MNDATSPLSFPCEFPIKAMGRAEPGFQARVEAIVRAHVPELSRHAVHVTHSARGNYVSVTVLITAHSREQLDAIYRDLTACEQVLVAL